MAKIKSLKELKKIKDQAKKDMSLDKKGKNGKDMVQVRVAMATCGIAAGAKEVMKEFKEEFERQGMDNCIVTQTGCMGYCYAEPTIEIVQHGKESIIYGDVDTFKVRDIVEKTIKNGELIDGIINEKHKKITIG